MHCNKAAVPRRTVGFVSASCALFSSCLSATSDGNTVFFCHLPSSRCSVVIVFNENLESSFFVVIIQMLIIEEHSGSMCHLITRHSRSEAAWGYSAFRVGVSARRCDCLAVATHSLSWRCVNWIARHLQFSTEKYRKWTHSSRLSESDVLRKSGVSFGLPSPR